jgi:hypothetical protein
MSQICSTEKKQTSFYSTMVLGVKIINFITKFYSIYYLGGLSALGGFNFCLHSCDAMTRTIWLWLEASLSL